MCQNVTRVARIVRALWMFHAAFARRREGFLVLLRETHTTCVGVPPDTRREPSRTAREVIRQSVQSGKRPSPPSRTLPARTEYYSRHERRHRVLELSSKPKELPEGPVDQRAWQQYQSYLSRVRPVARAEFYKRLMERQGLKTTRAVARVTGEDHSRVARVLKILGLPEPVLDYLRTHDSPTVVTYFTEKRLRDLVAIQDPRRIWRQFQEMLRELDEGVAG